MHTKFSLGNLKGSVHSEDVGVVNLKIILGWVLGKYSEKLWTGCMWHRIGTSGGLL
jgi:hypothetical protein